MINPSAHQSWRLKSEEDWESVLRDLRGVWAPNVWVGLRGDLGVGKTTFVRRLLGELGWTETVPSPSYPLMLEYHLPSLRVCHLDAFRLDPRHESPWSLDLLEGALVLVEWPERSGLPLERFDFELSIEVDGECRKAEWRALRS